MKRIYLVFIIICCGTIALAQPTLTQANFVPSINDSQLYYVADSTTTVLDNTTGANVIFDYTQIKADAPVAITQTQYVVNPTSTPNTLDFPSATFTDTTGGIPVNMKYNQDFTDSLDLIGLVLDINTFGLVVAKYDNDPEILMKFPFQYGDSFTDNYGGVFTAAAAPLPTNGNGTVLVDADAWGTLLLPMGVAIDSVLRISRVENLLTDTIFLQPVLPNILPIPINATQISYYKPSISKFPLLSYIMGDVNGDTSYSLLSQYPMYGVGIENKLNNKIDVSIYPNPTNNDFTSLTFNIENDALVYVNIFNTMGQNVKKVFNGKLHEGKNKFNIETSNLSKGLYFVNINIDDNNITKKLVIE